MIRTFTYVKRVGVFMSNGVGRYELQPPCDCGATTVSVDDYTTGEVKCNRCKAVISKDFAKDCIFP